MNLVTKLVIFLLTDFIIADGFSCYLCNGMQSSLQVCDEKILKAHCIVLLMPKALTVVEFSPS